MPGFDLEASLIAEDEVITKLIEISKSTPNNVECQGQLACSHCGKYKSTLRSFSERELGRWGTEDPEGQFLNHASKSACNCSYGTEGRKKQDTKPKRKGLAETSRNEQNNSKDFIAHNIRFCNANRYRDSYGSQITNQFVHYKDTSSYIVKYRAKKLEQVEHSSYQIDQSLFNEELCRSLTNSLSNLVGNISLTKGDAVASQTDLTKSSKSSARLKDSQLLSNLTSSTSDMDISDGQRKHNLKEIEFCLKCGDNLKEQDFLTLSRGIPLRGTSHEKIEEKKVKKLIKRSSDHRPRLIIEKPISELTRTDIDQSFTNELQPFCQQMPIQKNTLLEKRPVVRKDDGRGLHSPAKPRYSEGIRMQEENRNSRRGTGKSLDRADFLTCYREKYHLLKEST